jgi:hypothetical protein
MIMLKNLDITTLESDSKTLLGVTGEEDGVAPNRPGAFSAPRTSELVAAEILAEIVQAEAA